MGPFARVAIARPVQRTFHYRIPERLQDTARPGSRCVVPFGRTRTAGFIVGLDACAAVETLRDVAEILDPEPCIPEDLLRLGLWLASYYHHPPGETLSSMLPLAFRATATPVYRLGRTRGAPAGNGDSRGRLLDLVRGAGQLPYARIPRHLTSTLERLVQDGELIRDWSVSVPAGPRGEIWFSLNADASPRTESSRAPRQVEALAALREGPVPLRVLRESGVTSAVLRRLTERGWVERTEGPPRAVDLTRLSTHSGEAGFSLNREQETAVNGIARALEDRVFAPFLLQGVTGSGKTEVYIRAALEARRRGRGALVLVPEIALTPQILGRFTAALGGSVALLHSGLTARERALQWERLLRGDASVAVGARSAVFAPVKNLGLVVVDEEHETAFKQEEGLRYNGKHAALVRAKGCEAVALLGSATPDVETLWAARANRYRYLSLTARVGGARPPAVQVVDVRQEDRRRRSRVLLSEPLRHAVSGALGRGEQVLLFLNRRGFSPALVCGTCGEAAGCEKCSIALTLHRRRQGKLLLCHYCGHQRQVPATCPGCGGQELAAVGVGTQRIAELAAETWPAGRILRLDHDTSRRTGSAAVLGAFHRGEADILVGTQMVAKGHHFPRLTVVGVIDADLSLNFPDFRACERTFQLLTQVAGRAGRAEAAGLAVLQTRNPHHPVIQAVASDDYAGFAEAELDARREAGFPPFRRLAVARLSSPDEREVQRAARETAEFAAAIGKQSGVEILGPAPAPVERIRGRWRYQFLLRGPGPEPGPVQTVVRKMLQRGGGGLPQGLRFHVDLDPVSML